jgi:hypothetical protein
MPRELDVEAGDDNTIWPTVRLMAGAALLVLAGLSISTLSDPGHPTPSATFLEEGR